jgi:methyl-accepting chemotaxis protein
VPFRSIRRKLFLGLLAGTLFFALAMVVFAQTVIRAKLLGHLQQKGVVIAGKVASDSVNSVITERYFEVAMMFRDLQASDADVVYAFVVDEDGRDLASTFTGDVPPNLKQAHPVDPLRPYSTRELATDKGPVLDIGVPLLRGQIGVLHLGLSLMPIRREVNGIVLLIVLFSAGSLAAGAGAAVGFSRVLTRPLLKLAGAAETFGRGGTQVPVIVTSDDEVGKLMRVFNEMVENRRRIEGERERLIEELRHTLREVKTLRGFLPICSSCKKIRRDQGSWQQIESYIREHSEAEFSHGLCPECAKGLYPELWERIKDKTDATRPGAP